MTQIKPFFTSTLKIAAAIVLATLFLSLAGWGISSFMEHREETQNAPLEKPHTWAPISVPSLANATFKLSTIWRKGQLCYQFEMEGFPNSLESSLRNGTPSFTLSFLDENGFEVFDHRIIVGDFVRVISDKGDCVGISSKGFTFLDADTYRKARSWEITWNF